MSMRCQILFLILLFPFLGIAEDFVILRTPADSDGMIQVVPPSLKKIGQKREELIKDWEPLTVKKGFVLSNDLYYKRLCSKVWSKQIPAFKEKNPEVKNVDKFYPGDKILIQICEEQKKSIEEPKKEEVIVEKKEEIVAPICPAINCCNPCPQVEQKEVEEETPKIKKKEDYDLDGMIFAGLGFLTERYEDTLYSYTSFRYGIKKEIYTRIGYKLTLDFTKDVIFGSNKLQVKTAENKNQFYFSFGMGNRLGLVKREEYKLSDNLNSFSTAGFGLLYNFRGVDFDLELSSTLNANQHTNFSASGVKKMNDNYSLGGYFELTSTDPKVNDLQDQRLKITGGILILF